MNQQNLEKKIDDLKEEDVTGRVKAQFGAAFNVKYRQSGAKIGAAEAVLAEAVSAQQTGHRCGCQQE